MSYHTIQLGYRDEADLPCDDCRETGGYLFPVLAIIVVVFVVLAGKGHK